MLDCLSVAQQLDVSEEQIPVESIGMVKVFLLKFFKRHARLGGFVIGLLEALVAAAHLSMWKDAVVFLVLIIVLLVKPTGILGRNIQEKV